MTNMIAGYDEGTFLGRGFQGDNMHTTEKSKNQSSEKATASVEQKRSNSSQESFLFDHSNIELFFARACFQSLLRLRL